MVTIFIEREKRTIHEEFVGKIRTLLTRLNLNPETIILVKNGVIVSEDETCTDNDALQVLSVISGG